MKFEFGEELSRRPKKEHVPQFSREIYTSNPWNRVSEEALKIIEKRGIGGEVLNEIKRKLNDPSFEMKMRKRWHEESLRNRNIDPAEQERLWANGLVMMLKEDNN